MKKIFYNKVIRDKIPSRITATGADYDAYALSEREFTQELIKKVEEEASGMSAAKSKKELISEIADVIEVIEEVKKLKQIHSTDITKARQNNMKKKGGFKKRLFLRWAEDNSYHTNEKRNSKRS